MFLWLAPVLIALFAVLAFVATLAAWRLRRTAPRRLSLALSLAACLTIAVTALDLSVSLPAALCVRHLAPAGGDLEPQIAAELDNWAWWWRPCRRLELDVSAEQLGEPINFTRLAALAAARGIAVDVTAKDAIPLRGEQLALQWNGNTVPITTPVPASQIDVVRPVLSGHPQTPLVCGIERAQEFNSIHEILQTEDLGDQVHGFYPLYCHIRGGGDAPSHSAYIHVSSEGVAVVSKPPGRVVELSRTSDQPLLGLPPSVAAVDEDHSSIDAATMLVLDRPEKPASCDRARALLERGATVVIAMPGDDFVEHCDWLPVQPRRSPQGRNIIFDRRPRLTYILDDFADELQDRPSWVFRPTLDAKAKPSSGALVSSQKLMRDEAAQNCAAILKNEFSEGLDCGRQIQLAELSDEWIAALQLYRDKSSLDDPGDTSESVDSRRINRSAALQSLSELAQKRNHVSFRTRWENELVVVFTHDRRAPDRARELEFLESGSRVHIVTITDPYGESLRHHEQSSARSPALAGAPPLVQNSAPRLTRNEVSACPQELDRCLPSFDASLPDIKRQTGAEGQALAGRFAQRPERTEAPVRFGWWDVQGRPGDPFPAQVAVTTDEAGLVARPLAIAAMFGRGHLLFLGYSPIELDEATNSAWLNGPKGQDVLGGMTPIRALFAATEPFLTRLAGPVLAVDLQPDGAVRVTVIDVQGLDVDRVLDTMVFAHGNIRIVAPLVDFHAARRELVYVLPARELGEKLSRCTPLRAENLGPHDPIQVCPPPPAVAERRSLDPVTSLQLLARYTGGTDDPDAPSLGRDVLHLRTLGFGGLSLIFLFAWSRRAVRRVVGRRARRQMQNHEQQVARRYDPPDAVVAAGGDWDGRSSTWPRTGSFGGFRALEAGDRPSAIVMQDLLLPMLGGPQLLPRVAQRIEEAAPSVAMLVNLGVTMRTPGRAEDGKAMFAGRVAAHLAATAWRIQGEVSIQAVGVHGERGVLDPTCLSPGHQELLDNLCARLRQPVAVDTAWMAEVPECGAVVYVSDFQLEDDRDLQAWLARVEGQGVRVGGVLIYSAAEFTMIEGGRLAGSGVWADRADWDPDDVFEAFGRRRDRIEQIFDATTTGGLVVVATHFSQEDIEGALASGRLLQILR